jgi:hypothetical protein
MRSNLWRLGFHGFPTHAFQSQKIISQVLYLLQFSTICNTRGLEISRGKRHPLAGKIRPLDAKICQCLFLKGLIEAMFLTQTSICLSKMWNHWLSFAPECTRFKAMQFTGAKRVVMRSTEGIKVDESWEDAHCNTAHVSKDVFQRHFRSKWALIRSY